MTILSQAEIREAVEKGEIKFDPPLQSTQWHEATIDLRLGFKFTKWKDTPAISYSLARGFDAIADMGLWSEKVLKEVDEHGHPESYPLGSNEFVLGQTFEKIWIPRSLIAMVEGRSSYARAGVSVHQTAPFLQPGWSGQITLEIRNSGPLNLSLCPGVDRPCQVAFIRLTSVVPEDLAYGAKAGDIFQDQVSPMGKAKA